MFIRSARRGFTLIELMIVIAIVGILAGVMIPNYTKARAEGQMSGCIQNLKAIGTAQELYKNSLDSRKNNGGQYMKHIDYLVEFGYLGNKGLKCPSSGEAYQMELSADRRMYTVYCPGTAHSVLGVSENYPQYSPLGGLIESI